ncbi:MAG: universal stress protein [Ilumatobacteraceae bacterium]
MSARPVAESRTDRPIRGRVVVAVDPASPAGPAMAWAAAEVAARGGTLRVASIDGAGAFETVADLERNGNLAGDPADRDLVVVSGSTPAETARRLRSCVHPGASRRSGSPVVVVRGTARQPLRQIVVGIDTRSGGGTAMAWAVDEARLHGAELVIVHAWQRQAGGTGTSTRSQHLTTTAARCALDLAVQRCIEGMGPSVRGELIDGEPATVLTAASRTADLIVVGSRGGSGFKTMLYGSVTLFVSGHAACPVAVIPPRVRVVHATPHGEPGPPGPGSDPTVSWTTNASS